MNSIPHFYKKTLPLVLFVAAFGSPARSQAPAAPNPAPKTLRILTIGNSFSHNAVHYLPDLAKAAGRTAVLRELIIGGASMERHWQQVESARRDPKSKAALYSTKHTLQEELQAGPWDVVTIQQASIKSHDVNNYRPFASQLYHFIRENAPEAEICLHETWEYRRDDPRFSPKNTLPGEPLTQDAMYQGLSSAYATIAGELQVRRIPVGDAFHLADTDPQWGYKPGAPFDPKRAQAPTLPDQTHSLHVGWVWRKQPDGSVKLIMDGHHASMAGEYLGACVWYEFLFQEDVSTNTFVPKGLDRGYARFLRETAHRAVLPAR